MMSRVLTVRVPPQARELAGLERVDYQDAFAVRTAVRLPAEEWAWLALEKASPAVSGFAYRVQRALLGLRLAPRLSPDHPLGWEMMRVEAASVVLGAQGGIVTPRIAVITSPEQVVAATLLRYDSSIAPAVWSVVAPVHRAVARYLLEQAAGLAAVAERPVGSPE
jgi:hypothetical protein